MPKNEPNAYPNLNSQQVLSKALLRLVHNYELSRQDLCAIIGMSEATASRFFRGEKFIDPKSKQGELALLLLRLYRSLNALLGGNDEQARLWLKSYNHYLHAIPIEHITHISGLIATINYLDAMRGKL